MKSNSNDNNNNKKEPKKYKKVLSNIFFGTRHTDP